MIRDPRLPSLDGRYVYGDYCAGELLSARLRQRGATARHALHLRVPSLTSFGAGRRRAHLRRLAATGRSTGSTRADP